MYRFMEKLARGQKKSLSFSCFIFQPALYLFLGRMCQRDTRVTHEWNLV